MNLKFLLVSVTAAAAAIYTTEASPAPTKPIKKFTFNPSLSLDQQFASWRLVYNKTYASREVSLCAIEVLFLL